MLAVSLLWPVSSSMLTQGGVRSLRVTDRAGGLLREVWTEGRGLPVTLDRVSPAVARALVAVEDRRFYRHFGIDVRALGRAAWINVRSGRRVSGGSTITMQVARALRGRAERGSVWDKLVEMHLAVRLEATLSKDEILTLWLNRVPFGNQAYGIERAARLYLGKAARDLSTGEAAFLVGLAQSPSRYDPFRHLDRARSRQRRVLAAMEQAGRLSGGERERAEAVPVQVISPERVFRAPHFVEAVLAEGGRRDGAAEVRTTLDGGLQRAAEALMRGHIGQLRGSGVTNAAAVVLDNATGEVLAYAGSADFWDEPSGGQNDGVRMLRQPGSALKPFTYALALASGRYSPGSILPDLEVQVPEAGGAFSPENYDKRFHGPVPLRQALASSYNVTAVRMAQEFGPAALLRSLHAAGFSSLTRTADHYGVGLTLGNGEVRLLELARAYAGLARGGSLPPLRMEQWRKTIRGDTLAAGFSATPGIMAPEIAYLITDILKDPEARAPGFGRGGPLELPFPCAVKTGTSKDYRDNWVVGYTPRHTVAVWAGNFDGAPMQWVSGVSGAGPLMKSIFLYLGSGGEFVRPAGVEDGVVCPASGLRPGASCPTRRTEVFVRGTVPRDTCGVHRLVRIDRRTGLLADASTPAAEVKAEVFTVYPAEYHGWMQEQGMRMPPMVGAGQITAGNEEGRYSDRLRIEYPASGASFQIDPVLRASFQQIRFRGTLEEGLFDAAWWVDGVRLPGGLEDGALWALRPGRHTIELRAVDGGGGRLRSRPAVITISGVARTGRAE